MLSLPVYLDYNATTPVDERVLEKMLPYFGKRFGNAASLHHAQGRAADAAVKLAREQTATLIGGDAREIVFTSGATESVNLALKGVSDMYSGKGNHIITSVTEHSAVLDTCLHLEKKGAQITRLGVNQEGHISLDDLAAAIRPDTICIALMYANNETGVLHPVREISRIARENEVLFFCDATQAVGKVSVNVQSDGIDLLALSAHKIYGPKGVGALYIRRRDPRVRLTPQMDGGGHERGMRSGTLNVPGIVGHGAAAGFALEELQKDSAYTRGLRDQFESRISHIPGWFRNGDPELRLPQVTNFGFDGAEADQLILRLQAGLSMATGSACTAASPEPSHVLLAMGVGQERAKASVRVGFGRFSTQEEMEFAAARLSAAVTDLRSEIRALFAGNQG